MSRGHPLLCVIRDIRGFVNNMIRNETMTEKDLLTITDSPGSASKVPAKGSPKEPVPSSETVALKFAAAGQTRI